MTCNENPEQTSEKIDVKMPFWRRPAIILLLILLLAAFLRLVKPGQSPPGLNQDEAVHIWNAWCLLKMGKDQTGVSWPIFYFRTIGSNNTPLYIYALIPFLAVGGLSIWTARLLSAVAGIACIPVIYYVGSRLFNRNVGLMAALLLALNPWHLHLSRWAIEPGISPLISIIPLAMLLWPNMPISDDKERVPRPLIAVLAGVITGICCYGYWAVLFFIPVCLALIVIVNLPAYRDSVRTRTGVLVIMAFFISFAAIFSPLAWQYIFHPEGIARHAADKYWLGPGPLPIAIKDFVVRYLQHFSPSFLFVRPIINPIHSSPILFHWYMLPIMFLGLIVLVRNFLSSGSARVLFVSLFAYPLGDLIIGPPNALRSSPGLCSLVLLAAVGAVSTGKWLWQKNRKTAISAFVAFAVAVVGLNAKYLSYFYGAYNLRPAIYHFYHTDLVEACRWLKPRINEFDAVFCTTTFMNMPYIVTLVALDYDPHKWLEEPRACFTEGEFDYYFFYGKMHFMYDKPFIPTLNKLPAGAKILAIVRPGEFGLKNPIHQIYRPYDGEPSLWICQP